MIPTIARALAAAFLSTALLSVTTPVPARAEGATATIGDLVISDAWTRQSPPGARAGGGYATITNTGTQSDVLVGGSAPFAERFEVHEMSGTDGVMRMAELAEGLAIGPGQTVRLEPGGFHLMFLDMTEPPVAGTRVPVTLRFERAGEVTLDLPVAAIGATAPLGATGEGMDHGSMDHGAIGHGAMNHEASTSDAAD